MFSSTNIVNFSLRQNKAIERSIVFDGLREAMTRLDIVDPIYVGFGSVWFVDFHMAHRQLGIRKMISIEADEIIYRRAQFNRPYRCVEVIHGGSADVIPDLLLREELRSRPWIVWLDYDKPLDEDRLGELRYLVHGLPSNSFLIATLGARPRDYGARRHRAQRLEDLLGNAAQFAPSATNDEDVFAVGLAKAFEAALVSTGINYGKAFVPAFRLPYRDGAPMTTVGGFLPGPDRIDSARSLFGNPSWHGLLDEVIATPPLTAKEVTALQAILPHSATITRTDVRSLGFDLDDNHLRSFVAHYLRFPTFAQIAR